jgi:hypothetical protein
MESPKPRMPKVECECGRIVQLNSIVAHNKSHLHKAKMSQVPSYTIRQGKFLVSFN